MRTTNTTTTNDSTNNTPTVALRLAGRPKHKVLWQVVLVYLRDVLTPPHCVVVQPSHRHRIIQYTIICTSPQGVKLSRKGASDKPGDFQGITGAAVQKIKAVVAASRSVEEVSCRVATHCTMSCTALLAKGSAYARHRHKADLLQPWDAQPADTITRQSFPAGDLHFLAQAMRWTCMCQHITAVKAWHRPARPSCMHEIALSRNLHTGAGL